MVPDVIDVAPSSTIQVTYEGGLEVNMGNELTPTQVKDPPIVAFPAEDGSLYTLCMSDPDAPSRLKPEREVNHWLIVNIPGNDIAKGEVLSDYIGSGPPPGSGLHRYIFLVYKQPGKVTCDKARFSRNPANKERAKFTIRNFAKEFNLGNPVAGNFYQAQYDDYVPELYKKLQKLAESNKD